MLHTPVRQWVLIGVMRLPIPLRPILAAQPKLVMPVLQVVHRVITRDLLGQAGGKPDEGDSGAITLIQRFEAPAPTDQTLMQTPVADYENARQKHPHRRSKNTRDWTFIRQRACHR